MQAEPVSVAITVEMNGKDLVQRLRTFSVRSINECLLGYVTNGTKFHDTGIFFAAYVNEENPMIDKLLREALDTRIVNRFLGYQGGAEVVDRQVYALWNVLQKRKFRYSSVSNTSLSSNVVFSQRVRTFDDALESSQINCVDGSVLFASLLRAINIEPILVRTPGHMFVGYYTDSSHKDMNFLETTMIGDVDLDDFFPDEQLDSTMVGKSQNQMSRITFDTYAKAQILKNVLENEGIEAYIHNVNLIQPVISSGVRLRIKESDLPHALQIIESSAWLSEDIIKGKESSSEKNKEKRKVLIPVDFSNYSLKACQFGFSFANAINSEVVLLHAYFSPIYVPTIPYGTDNFNFQIEREESVKSMIETVHNELNKLSDTIKKKVESGEFPNIKYTCILRDGIPEEEILRYAKEYNPQIIIMGTRGRSQKDIDLIGSVTAEVIERSQSFVYAIPEHTPLKTFNDIKKVAFVTNFDQRDLIAFDSLINVFKSFHFAVSFVHLSTDNDAWHEIKLAGIKDYFQKQYSKLELHYNVVKEDNILSNLDKYVKEENIDVICITNYKRNIFARLFNPSIARKMIFHANTPILVIK